MQKKEYSLEIGGKTMTAEFNDWADQANGSVLLRYGNSAVLATVVMGSKESDKDYFPLSVEYEEKFYAAGAILGSRFMRREGRPSDEAVLSGRIVDSTIRPLFPKGMKRDVQVIISVLSIEDYDTDILAVNAASLAIATSNIPWNGPVSSVRIGITDENDELIVNPSYGQRSDELPPKAKRSKRFRHGRRPSWQSVASKRCCSPRRRTAKRCSQSLRASCSRSSTH